MYLYKDIASALCALRFAFGRTTRKSYQLLALGGIARKSNLGNTSVRKRSNTLTFKNTNSKIRVLKHTITLTFKNTNSNIRVRKHVRRTCSKPVRTLYSKMVRKEISNPLNSKPQHSKPQTRCIYASGPRQYIISNI